MRNSVLWYEFTIYIQNELIIKKQLITWLSVNCAAENPFQVAPNIFHFDQRKSICRRLQPVNILTQKQHTELHFVSPLQYFPQTKRICLHKFVFFFFFQYNAHNTHLHIGRTSLLLGSCLNRPCFVFDSNDRTIRTSNDDFVHFQFQKCTPLISFARQSTLVSRYELHFKYYCRIYSYIHIY